MVELNDLKRLTKELAEEIEYSEDGPALDWIKLVLSSIKSPVAIITREYKVIYLNPEAKRIGKKYNISTEYDIECYKARYNNDKPCKNCPMLESIKTKQIVNTVWKSPHSNIEYVVTNIPLVFNGVAGSIEIFNKNGINNGNR